MTAARFARPWSDARVDRDLPAEIAAYLAHVGFATVEQIARAIRARTESVRLALRDDARFSGPLRLEGRSPRAKFYRLAATPGTGRDGSEQARLVCVRQPGMDALSVRWASRGGDG